MAFVCQLVGRPLSTLRVRRRAAGEQRRRDANDKRAPRNCIANFRLHAGAFDKGAAVGRIRQLENNESIEFANARRNWCATL